MILRKEINYLLSKYYINYDKNKWDKFVKGKKLIEEDFNKLWKKEHGGYISKKLTKELQKDIGLPKFIPSIKDDIFILPAIPSNDKKFQKKYVKIANKLLLNNDREELIIDLGYNGGGKPEVMIAGLLPIFNISKKIILTYIKNKKGYVKDIVKHKNCITSIINAKSSICGTKKKLKNLKKITILINKYTASAAEQTIIALFSLLPYIKIVLTGKKTAGYTTTNKYFILKDGSSIEIPFGYMADVNKNIYVKGIKSNKK